MSNLEFVVGQESHISNWGKFYVKGLEPWQVKEDFPENQKDKHCSYQGYVCLDVREDRLFTIFYQDGDKRGTYEYRFYICITSDQEVQNLTMPYGSGKILGNFKILCQALTLTKSPRLMNWWIDSPIKTKAFALHCAAHIDKRGLKTLPPMMIS
jgi:hypothetical protein